MNSGLQGGWHSEISPSASVYMLQVDCVLLPLQDPDDSYTAELKMNTLQYKAYDNLYHIYFKNDL